MRTNGVIIGILGLWLIVSGLIGFAPVGNVWNDWIVGVIVAILGFAMAGAAPGHGILTGILGLWMILSAFIPGVYAAGGARVNDIAVGIILAIAGFSVPRRRAEAIYDIRRAA